MRNTEHTFNTILDIAISFSKETDKTAILNTILTESMNISRCDGGTLYVLRENQLHFFLMKTLSQQIDRGLNGETIDLPPVAMYPEYISAYAALTKQPIRIDDVYEEGNFDFSGPKRYDQMTGYHTCSMLAVPLVNQEEEVIGVIQLINAMNTEGEICPFSQGAEKTIFALSSLAYEYEGEKIPYFTEEEKNDLSVRKGTLTSEERRIMESHVEMTERILEKVHFNSYFQASPIYAGQHHEYLDGSGYPHRLTSDQIPLESRILAAVDIFDALLAADRPYKKPMSREKAISILMDMAEKGKLDSKICRYLDEATAL